MAHPASLASAPKSQTMLAIGLVALGFFSFAVCDAIGKLLTRDLPPIEVVWFRHLGLVSIAIWLLARKGLPILRSRRRGLQLSRALVAAMSSTIFFTALAYIPLSDAVAVAFTAPFMVTAIGAIVLKEHVGFGRWMAVAVAFLGTLVVIRPGLGVVHPAIFLVLLSSLLFAVRQILSRILGAVDLTATTITYTAIGSALLLTIPTVMLWETPSGANQLVMLAAIALTAGAGEVLFIRAFEMTQAATLSPLQYSQILWSTIFGWTIFSQLPDRWTLLGMIIIMGSGIYVVHRERRMARTG